jgi:DNA-binding SARP family transcriptional activator/tetratricopeptide (TPR) repeat protein
VRLRSWTARERHVEFRILGPLEVVEDGRQIDLGGAKQQGLLACLLLHANEVMSSDGLIDALWEEGPPETAAKALQVYVSQLRKALGKERLQTRPPGYLLRVDGDELDLVRFERLVAAGEFREALSLWRGPALAEFAYQGFAQTDIARLAELRMTCIEDRIDADLIDGRHTQVVGELEALVARHPLRERLRGQLMLALYRSGRQAEALDVYTETRRALAEELGLEPGDELRRFQRAILDHDPSLNAPLRGVSSLGPEHHVPAKADFVGRKVELGRLQDGLDEAIAGRGRLFLISGEPGIGKSRLAEEVMRRARERGALVLVGRCWEAGGAPAHWPWVQAVRSYIRECDPTLLRAQLGSGATDLTQLFPDLRELFPDLPEPPAPESEGARFRLFDAVVAFLRNTARERPLVLVFDDLHAADEPSLLLLRFFARELGTSRLLVLAAYRDVDPSLRDPLLTTLSELAREPVTRRVSLGGLAQDDIAEYIAISIEIEPEATTVAEIHAESDGNPLFVGEIVRLLASEGRLGERAEKLQIPSGVREVIGSRLRRLSGPCQKVLTRVSVLGREFDVDVVQRLSGLPREALIDVLDEAISERVVGEVPGVPGRLRFAHVLIRDTLYDDLTVARRMQLHRDAGEGLEDVYAGDLEPHLAEIALHLFASAPAGTAESAVDYSRRAGDRAVSLLAFEEAARLYEMALTLSQDNLPRCELLLALGDAQARSGDTPSSKKSFLEAAELAETLGASEQLARAALGYGGRIIWEVSRDDEQLVPLLERSLSALGDRDSTLRVRLQARLAGGPFRDASFPPSKRASLSAEALNMARRIGDPPTLAYALAGYIHSNHTPDRTRETLDVATELIAVGRRAREAERVVEGLESRFELLLQLGDVAGAEASLKNMSRMTKELGQPAQDWLTRACGALLALLAGRFAEAEALIHEALELGELAQRWNARVSYRLQIYLLRRAQGRLDELLEPFEAHRDAFQYRTYPVWDCVLARFYGELGRESEARALFEALAADDFAGLPFDEEWLVGMSLLAETAASRSDAQRAATLYELLQPYADLVAVSYPEISLGSVSRYLGLLATTTELLDVSERHFARAVEMNERVGARPWLAHTQHDYADMLLKRDGPDDRKRAYELEDASRALADEIGMRLP